MGRGVYGWISDLNMMGKGSIWLNYDSLKVFLEDLGVCWQLEITPFSRRETTKELFSRKGTTKGLFSRKGTTKKLFSGKGLLKGYSVEVGLIKDYSVWRD